MREATVAPARRGIPSPIAPMEDPRNAHGPFPVHPARASGDVPAAGGGFRQSGRRTLAEVALVLAPILLVIFSFRSCQGAITDAVVARIPASTDQVVGHSYAELQRQSQRLQGDVDAAQTARIQRAFDAVVGALTPAERAALPGLRVTAVRDETPNAFALPGGEVFVMTGLLTRVKDDDEALRGVLAHELGHAVRRHGMRRLVGSQVVMIAASVLIGDVAGASGQVVALAAGLEGLRYGRAMEDEADAFGAALLGRMGQSPEGLARFLESLGSQPVPSILSTHPDPAERARLLRARARR